MIKLALNMSNMFKNAKFGKSYKTRDGRKFVYLGEVRSLSNHGSAFKGMTEHDGLLSYYNSEGKHLHCEYKGSAINAFVIDFRQVDCEEDCVSDIVSEWQEPITEEELDKLSEKAILKEQNINNFIHCPECKTNFHFVDSDIIEDVWVICPTCKNKICILE